MSSQIVLKVGPTSGTVTIGAGITDAKVGAALTRYATSLAIPVTGDAQTDLIAVLNHFVDLVKRRSTQAQVSAAQAASLAMAQSQADSDNNL